MQIYSGKPREIERRQINENPSLVIFGEHVTKFGPKTKLLSYMFETAKVVIDYEAFAPYCQTHNLAPAVLLCGQLTAIGVQRAFLSENLGLSEVTVTRYGNVLADNLGVNRNCLTRTLFDIEAHRVVRALLPYNLTEAEVALAEQKSHGVTISAMQRAHPENATAISKQNESLIHATGFHDPINRTLGLILSGHIGDYAAKAIEPPLPLSGPAPLYEVRAIEEQ